LLAVVEVVMVVVLDMKLVVVVLADYYQVQLFYHHLLHTQLL
jgi:hypothetical protein